MRQSLSSQIREIFMKKTKITVTAVMLSLFVIVMGILWRVFIYESPQIRFVKNMGQGINIGNSLDAKGLREYHPEAGDLEFETSWGNPEITEELFVMIKEAGFSTVRIPVTWQDHMDENGVVAEVWMDRVQEVVDMALAQELYVILNTHHEEWMDLQLDREDEIAARFSGLWEQIAVRFSSYDEKLLFEGMNEPRLRDSEHEWTAGTEELRDMVNRLNRVFVDTVRNTGAGNEERYLLICPYATNHVEEAMNDLDVPDGNIIVSIHMYSPYTFCQDENGIIKWDMSDAECAGYADEVRGHFANMEHFFVRKGIPVILTEFGCTDKDNLESRMEWIRFYKEEAEAVGVPCIWWDNGSNYQIMDRSNYSWTCPEIKDALIH